MPGESRGRVRKQNGERGNRRRSHWNNIAHYSY
jgi:hypothetical protein